MPDNVACLYHLLLVDTETGILLNQAGEWHIHGQPDFRPVVDSWAAALKLKDELLSLFPWAEVAISSDDSHTTPQIFHAPPDALDEYHTLKKLHTAYITASPLRRAFMDVPLHPRLPSSYCLLRERKRVNPVPS